MLATSPSPSIPARRLEPAYSPRPQYDQPTRPLPQVRSPVNERIRSYHLSPELSSKPHRGPSTKSLDRYSPPVVPHARMVDAGTQYSPPDQKVPSPSSTKTPTSTIAGLHLSEKEEHNSRTTALDSSAPRKESISRPAETVAIPRPDGTPAQAQGKRHAVEPAAESSPATNGVEAPDGESALQSPVKKARADAPPVRLMTLPYEDCNTRDLVVLISSMLMELIRFNDAIPLRDGQLTRFHSRAPPAISVLDYLQRLTTHATLSPPILLSVVYYIDRLCALYPAFTISSLTVHRFLITSATVASKGLSDSFWTNKTYARVGGVSMKELALLELEFLERMEWRIVPKPEVLVDYYKSLIERNSEYQLDT